VGAGRGRGGSVVAFCWAVDRWDVTVSRWCCGGGRSPAEPCPAPSALVGHGLDLDGSGGVPVGRTGWVDLRKAQVRPRTGPAKVRAPSGRPGGRRWCSERPELARRLWLAFPVRVGESSVVGPARRYARWPTATAILAGRPLRLGAFTGGSLCLARLIGLPLFHVERQMRFWNISSLGRQTSVFHVEHGAGFPACRLIALQRGDRRSTWNITPTLEHANPEGGGAMFHVESQRGPRPSVPRGTHGIAGQRRTGGAA